MKFENATSTTAAKVGEFQILSLDGGGIRGLYSAAILTKWEEDLVCCNSRSFTMSDLF